MGIETALIVGGLSLAKGIGDYNQAKSAARATAKEGAIAIYNRKQEIQNLVAKQKIGYLQSGVELEGTAQKVMQNTYNTGIADIQAIGSSYQKNIKNQMTAARSQLLGSIAGAATSLFSAGSSLSSAAGSAGLSAEQLGYYNQNSAGGIGISGGWGGK
jgi:hypothetical protein